MKAVASEARTERLRVEEVKTGRWADPVLIWAQSSTRPLSSSAPHLPAAVRLFMALWFLTLSRMPAEYCMSVASILPPLPPFICAQG